MPHTHLIGRSNFILYYIFCSYQKLLIKILIKGKEVFSKVIRDGKELGYITNNRNYDFNYQYYNFLTKPFALKKVNLIYIKGLYSALPYRVPLEFLAASFTTPKTILFYILI
jgi:hypothetical protein